MTRTELLELADRYSSSFSDHLSFAFNYEDKDDIVVFNFLGKKGIIMAFGNVSMKFKQNEYGAYLLDEIFVWAHTTPESGLIDPLAEIIQTLRNALEDFCFNKGEFYYAPKFSFLKLQKS